MVVFYDFVIWYILKMFLNYNSFVLKIVNSKDIYGYFDIYEYSFKIFLLCGKSINIVYNLFRMLIWNYGFLIFLIERFVEF